MGLEGLMGSDAGGGGYWTIRPQAFMIHEMEAEGFGARILLMSAHISWTI